MPGRRVAPVLMRTCRVAPGTDRREAGNTVQKEDSMDRFRKTAVYEEFPYIRKFLANSRSLESVRVKRIDENLLLRRAEEEIVVGSLVNIDRGTDYWIVAEGSEAGVFGYFTVERTVEYISSYAGEDGYKIPGETILEAIDRHGLQDKRIIAIVGKRYGYDVVDHVSRDSWSMTIYKPGKDVDIARLIKQAKADALTKLRAEADF